MKLTKLDHSALIVDDVERTRHFYGTVLGLEEVPRPSSFTFGGCWFRGPDFELHFILASDTTTTAGFGDPGPGGRQGLAHHIAFLVDDFDAAARQLEEHKIPLAAGPFQRGDGVVQLYVNDPDGNLLEFFTHAERSDIAKTERAPVRQ